MSLNYDPSIPAASDILSESQSDLLTNFTDIPTYMNVNHEDFTSSSFGKHKFVTLTRQAGGGLTTLTNEIGLFCQNDAFNNPQLFYRSSGQVAGSPATQLTPIPSIFAWGSFNSVGALGIQNYNVTGPVVVNGDKSYTINFTNPRTSGNFFPWFMPFSSTAIGGFPNVLSVTPNSITVIFATGFALSPATVPTVVSFMIWAQ